MPINLGYFKFETKYKIIIITSVYSATYKCIYTAMIKIKKKIE